MSSPVKFPLLHVDPYDSLVLDTPQNEGERPLFMTPTPTPKMSARVAFSSIKKAERLDMSDSPEWNTTPVSKAPFKDLLNDMHLIEQLPGERWDADYLAEMGQVREAFIARVDRNEYLDLITNVDAKIAKFKANDKPTGIKV